MIARRSFAFDAQVQEVRGAGDARVVVADGLLALPLQLVFLDCKMGLDKLPEVTLDGFQVLRGRGNNLGVHDNAAVIEAIAVIEDSPRRFGAAVASGGARLDGDR